MMVLAVQYKQHKHDVKIKSTKTLKILQNLKHRNLKYLQNGVNTKIKKKLKFTVYNENEKP